MKRILLLLLCLAFSLPYVSAAQDIDDKIRAAESGDPIAQYNLALRYFKGEGVPQNDAEAAKWYRLAAAQGNAGAQFNLGGIYDTGKGVAENDAEAVKWYRLAAEQGDVTAQSNLGIMYATGVGVPQNYAEAYVWFSLAVASGAWDVAHKQYLSSTELSNDALVAAQQRAAKLFEEIEARKAASD